MNNILSHKEFRILKYKKGDKLPIASLQLAIQQLFTIRWMRRINQLDKHMKRLFLIHDMGSGKTITSIMSMAENRELYKLYGEGHIIVISFQKNTFIDELLSRPELGYINQDEADKIARLRSLTSTEYGRMNYHNYILYLKKRILSIEGIIHFIGFQELHNMLFANLHAGEEVSQDILALFSNASIICDEIHNTYNSQNMNIYGDAIKYILNYYTGREDEPYTLFMSGTPINNKPSEIIDILSLATSVDLAKSDFFSDGEVEKLKPGALGRIASVASGYFSFYKNEDLSLLPRRIFDGRRVGALHFIECSYVQAQKKIIDHLDGKIGLDDNNIYDIVFPSSEPIAPWGIPVFYKNSDYARIELESINWKNKNGIDYNGSTIVGNILSKKNIGQWSNKYFRMLEEIENLIADDSRRGKIIINHEFINGSGIKLLEQILIANGYLTETGAITDHSLCSKCGKMFSKHEKFTLKIIHSVSRSDENISKPGSQKIKPNESDHIFEPVRFLSIYGELDKQRISAIMSLYNSEYNREGHKFMILLGSEMIREGYNFKCVREIWAMHLLPHISAMLQLWGRAIRMYSHDLLPPEKRVTRIKIFATPIEIDKYSRKMENFKIIQEIMRVINIDAIDSRFYYDFIKNSFLARESKSEIGLLPYDLKSFKYEHIKLDTYNVFYGEWEVEEIKKIILSLFYFSPAWNYEDLLKAVRNPPFIQNIDYSQISEDNFILALGDLMYSSRPKVITKSGVNYKIVAVNSDEVIYYVVYPVAPVSEISIGTKIEDLNGRTVVNHISWLQPKIESKNRRITITDNLLNLNTNYDEMKRKFYNKYHAMTILEIPQSTEVYGLDFHIRLIEEAIMYVFNIMTRINEHRSEYHEFYFKMLHFYKKIDLILYADMLIPEYLKFYEKYIISLDKIGVDVNATNSLLKSNLSNVSSSSISSFEISGIDKYIDKHRGKPIGAEHLPVGHMLTASSVRFVEPKLYTPQGWFIAKNFIIEQEIFPENDIIVGFYTRIDNSINFKFKLRPPTQKIAKTSDRRELEKGMVCETISKKKLESIASQLGVIATGTNIALCDRIKEILLYRELKERNRYNKGKQPSRLRWCYMQNERA